MNQAFTHSVKTLNVLLRNTLGRNKTHTTTTGRFANGFCSR